MKKLISLALVMMLIGSLAGCGSKPAETTAAQTTAPASTQGTDSTENSGNEGDIKVTSTDKITLKLGHANAENSVFHEACVVFKEEVERMTNGNLVVELYPSNALGGSKEIVQSVSMGAVELNISGSAQFTVFNEQLSVLDLPFLFAERENAYALLDGEAGAFLAEGLAPKNIKVLGYLDGGYRCMFNSKRALNTPDDFNGLTVRVQDSEVYFNMMNTLGALPSFLPWGDLYVSISSNVVEAGEGGLSQIYTQRFYEVAPYVSLTNHTLTINPFVMSLSKWEALPADYQAVVEAAAKTMVEFERNRMIEAEKEARELLLQNNVQINEVDAAVFQEKVAPVWDAFAAKYGQELVDRFTK